MRLPEAQVNTQEYGRRPYGVGFLVIGLDATGPHLYEFSPSGSSLEYVAMSIGARSQSAKTYLEKHYEKFESSALQHIYNPSGILTVFIHQVPLNNSLNTVYTLCARHSSRTRN